MLQRDEEFVTCLIEMQPRLYGYILSLVANCEDADDLVQRTNVVLLRKQSQFQTGTDFWAWAKQVAQFEVRGFRKELARNRVILSDELVAQLTQEESEFVREPDAAKADLRKCLGNLSRARRELLERRYSGTAVANLAKEVGRTAAALSQELYRMRADLAKCIRYRLSQDRT
ncbi:sigma-70 family RNA polymerase sigma factor [Aeoliella mucimassa]|uniref:RNA polymerase sigma factor n=1 Tax=Aeoliella mucimassa TaxID=2527972 RepID=A0A518AQJ5_9BACT|nr:sigma-70 family RNA polymerase sigma factor [Aeoliella mucimassa]QDU57001.1 RNA polymerase sigma factor [Aeoliella mucimassa]